MKNRLIFTFIAIMSLNLQAQKLVKGIFIVNSDSKVPISEAYLRTSDNVFQASANDRGYIDVEKLPMEANEVLISCIGYETAEVKLSELTLLNSSAIVELNSKVSSIQEIQITGESNRGIFKAIGDLDIHLRPINNSQEVLRMVPGLFIGQHAGGGKAEQIFLRGFDLDHGTDINITVDGMPVNMVSHAHGQGYADLHFVIPELIDKVNFNKGPYYADKGNFTTAGFVEFKTKDYLDRSFAKVEAGQFNTYRGIIGLNLLPTNIDKRTQSLYVASEMSLTDGYFVSTQNFNRFNTLLKYHGEIDRQNSLTAVVSTFSSKWNASGQIPDRAIESGLVGFYGAIDNTEGGKTSRQNASIELMTKLNNGGIMRNQLFYSKYDFELYSNFTFFKEDPIDGDQIRQKEDRNILGFNNSFQKIVHLGNLLSETKAGVQVRYDDVNDIELTRTKNRIINKEELKLGDINELNVATYWSQKLRLSSKLDLTGALRFDYFKNEYHDQLLNSDLQTYSSIVSPKLNFNYQLNDKVQLYFYNGRGFHSNDTRVAVLQNGKKVLPPAYGSDLGSVFKIGDKLLLQSALWYLWLDQEFVYVGDEGVVEAGGQTQRFGLDLSVRYEILHNLFADVDVSLANPRAIDAPRKESYLPLAPRFTSVGGLTYRQKSAWNGSLRYRFMSDRPANEDNSVIAESYFIIDAAINYSMKRWELGLSIQNLLNTKWKETQFDTESQLKNEASPVSEIHFTPGTPFFARLSFTLYL